MREDCETKKGLHSNVINIKSEILFREAEDNFLYFNQLEKSKDKLLESLELTPIHYKSNILLGDIYFIKGNFTEAFECYKKAEITFKNDPKVLASIANCFEVMGDFLSALKYCEKAFLNINDDNVQLLPSLYELKIKILVQLKKYESAKQIIDKAKRFLSIDEIITINSHKNELTKKLSLIKKVESLKLQVL